MDMDLSYILAAIIYVVIVASAWYVYGQTAGETAAVASLVVPLLTFLLNGLETRREEDAQETNEEDIAESVVTFKDRKRQAKERLDSHFTLRESANGEIELQLNAEEIRGADRAAMMWVFGKWALADTNPEYSKILTVEELRNQTELKGGAVKVFLNKMEQFLDRHYPEDPEDRREIIDEELVRMDETEMEFELNEHYLEEIVDYILGERDAPN